MIFIYYFQGTGVLGFWGFDENIGLIKIKFESDSYSSEIFSNRFSSSLQN